MDGLDNLSRLSTAKRLFKRLAKIYLDKRQPPSENKVKELWEFRDLLDLKTVLKWRDEAGVKRGILFEDRKVEFDEWPNPPHEDLIRLFENLFKSQFVNQWIAPNYYKPNFDGKHTQGKNFSPSPFFSFFLFLRKPR